MGILREIRRLPEQIHGLAVALKAVSANLAALIELQQANGPSDERLEQLELSRATWEAEMTALLLKAESTLKSAANAESRSRTMMKHAEKLTGPFTENGEPLEEGIPPEYAVAGKEEGVPPVRVDVAPVSQKELAKRMKFMS